MNSKFNLFFFLVILFSLPACGVKGTPLQHPDTVIESYVQKYTGSIDPNVTDESSKNQPMPAAPKN